jgi:hypothetical protein
MLRIDGSNKKLIRLEPKTMRESAIGNDATFKT